MNQPIVGYHLDEHSDWVADLACGHGQHVRHQPPFFSRPWVLTERALRSVPEVEMTFAKIGTAEVATDPMPASVADGAFVMLKERAEWPDPRKPKDEDKQIQALVREIGNVPTEGLPAVGAFSKATADALKGYNFDRKALGSRGLGYEKLDQLTLEVLLGVR